MLFIKEEEVLNLVSIRDATEAIEEMMRLQGLGKASMIPREAIHSKSFSLYMMMAISDKHNISGFKAFTLMGDKMNFVVLLFDNSSGELLALIEADILGRLRTGAASALASKYLAKRNLRNLGIIGSGRQAWIHALALSAILGVKEMKIYSRNPENAYRMAKKLEEKGFHAYNVKNYEEACKADVIVTATNSKEPIIKGEWISEGSHINLIGSHTSAMAEAYPDVFGKASIIVTDSKEQALKESGDLIKAVEAKVISWDQIRELWEVILKKVQRKSEEEITIFKSHGIALWDLAIANLVYRRAISKGVGKEIPFKGYVDEKMITPML